MTQRSNVPTYLQHLDERLLLQKWLSKDCVSVLNFTNTKLIYSF